MDRNAPTPNRRFTDVVEQPTTLIGRSTCIRGELTSSEPVEIRGSLEGDTRVSAHCTVTEGARVAGSIQAATLVVAGEVEGQALRAEKIQIATSGHVRAALVARVIAIADGAFFEGRVEMEGPDAASGPVIFKEQRQAPPEQTPKA